MSFLVTGFTLFSLALNSLGVWEGELRQEQVFKYLQQQNIILTEENFYLLSVLWYRIVITIQTTTATVSVRDLVCDIRVFFYFV